MESDCFQTTASSYLPGPAFYIEHHNSITLRRYTYERFKKCDLLFGPLQSYLSEKKTRSNPLIFSISLIWSPSKSRNWFIRDDDRHSTVTARRCVLDGILAYRVVECNTVLSYLAKSARRCLCDRGLKGNRICSVSCHFEAIHRREIRIIYAKRNGFLTSFEMTDGATE